MIVLITGTSHTGKTNLAQRLLEKHGWPYLSLDHLKMGLIRSKYTNLTVEDDDALTALMWPIVREMIKTAIENGQNLVIEGCYLPFDWRKDFSAEYLPHIRFVCLVMTESYLRTRFDEVRRYANVIETRISDDLSLEELIRDNERNMALCRKHDCEMILINGEYRAELP